MQIALEEYFQQTLQKHRIIDQRLTPLLSRVRKNHINSIHQLKEQLTIGTSNQPTTQPEEEELSKKIFWYQPSKTLPSKQKTVKSPRTARAILHSTLQARPKKFSKTMQNFNPNPEERKISMNPLSKVRRHLIDYINFKELQRAMHQRPEKVNAYQRFCSDLRERSQSHSERRVISSSRKASKDERGSEPDLQTFLTEQNGFKITHRKKFWRPRGESRRRRDSEGQEYLKVKGLFSTLI